MPKQKIDKGMVFDFHAFILDRLSVEKGTVEALFGWLRHNVDPEMVYERAELEEWAEENGFIRAPKPPKGEKK